MFSVNSKEGDIGDSSMARDKPVMVKLSLKVMCDKNTTFRSDDDEGGFLGSMAGTCFYNISAATASPPVSPPTSPVLPPGGGSNDGRGFIM